MKFRPSYRAQLRASAQALDGLAKLYGREHPASLEAQLATQRTEAKPRQRNPDRVSEAQVLKAVLHALRVHPRVARVWRQNAGALMGDDRYVSLGPTGIADVIGYLKDGRFLAVEVKAPDGTMKPHQQAFLDDVLRAGGVAFVARSVDDVINGLR